MIDSWILQQPLSAGKVVRQSNFIQNLVRMPLIIKILNLKILVTFLHESVFMIYGIRLVPET